jgi:ABC-2 type transport system permease protein
MRAFFRQFKWELRRLAAQRRTRLGFAMALAFELIGSLLLQLPATRLLVQADFRRVHIDFHSAFSGLTTASHVMGNAFMYVGIPFLALGAGEIIAGEFESGTLRMILSRPVRRETLLLQKLLACLCHALALTAFIAITSLAIGLALDGCGPLVMVITSEAVFGTFEFADGLARYSLAVGLLAITGLTVPLLAMTLSSFRIKPAAAAVLALTVSLADGCIWVIPGMLAARPYLLTTRLVAWMHAFDNVIPWELIRRNYTQLLTLDALLILVAFAAFRRLEIKR